MTFCYRAIRLCFLFLSIAYSAESSKSVEESQSQCPTGWRYASHNSDAVCVKRFTNKLPYEDAKKNCRDHGAFLINLDLPIITQILVNDSYSDDKNMIFSPERPYWTGLHYDGDAFVWDGFLPTSPLLNLYCSKNGEEISIGRTGGSGWFCDQLPRERLLVSKPCIAANLVEVEANILPATLPSNVTIAKLEIDQCSTSNEFICAGHGRSYCNEGWSWNNFANACVRTIPIPRNLSVHTTNASIQCGNLGAKGLNFTTILHPLRTILSQVQQLVGNNNTLWVSSAEECGSFGPVHCCARFSNGSTASGEPRFEIVSCELPNFYICKQELSFAKDAHSIKLTNSTDADVVHPNLTLDYDNPLGPLLCSMSTAGGSHAFLTPSGEITSSIQMNLLPSYYEGGTYKCVAWSEERSDYKYSNAIHVNGDGALYYATVTIPLEDEYTSDWYENMVAFYPSLNRLPPDHFATLIPLIIRVTDELNRAFKTSIESIADFVECATCLDSGQLEDIKFDVLRIKDLSSSTSPLGMLVSTEVVLHLENNITKYSRSDLATSTTLLLRYMKSNLIAQLKLNASETQTVRILNSDDVEVGEVISDVKVRCPAEKRFIPELNKNVTLPRAVPGEIVNRAKCRDTDRPIVTALCNGSAEILAFWQVEEVQPCVSKDKSAITNELENVDLNLDAADTTSAVHALTVTAKITNDSSLDADAVSYVAEILTQLTNVTLENKTVLNEYFSSFVDIINNVMNVKDPDSTDPTSSPEDAGTNITTEEERSIKSSRRILSALNSLTRIQLPPDISASDGDIYYKSSSNIAVKLTIDPDIVKLTSSISEDGNIDIKPVNTSDSSSDNQSTVLNLTLSRNASYKNETVRKAIIVFGNDRLHKPADKNVVSVNNIASVSLATFDGTPINVSDTENAIRIRFMRKEQMSHFNESQLFCGYWEEKGSNWSREGCTKTLNSDGDIICTCDHLTDFSVIVVPSKGGNESNPIHAKILTTISTLGLSVSSAALALVLLTGAVFRRLRKFNSQKVLLCLSLCLLGLNLTFLFGVDRTESRAGCITAAVVLHYFLLASFSWMMVEAVLQYLRFVKILGTYIPRFMLKSCITAFGIPAVIVGITLAIDVELYKGNDKFCWMKDQAMYYAVLIPIGLVLVANTSIFVMVMHGLISSNRRMKQHRVTGSDRATAILHLRVAIATFIILGLTWVFGFIALIDPDPDSPSSLAFQYLFCIFNSLQGFLIFIFHNIRERSVQAAWTNLCRCFSKHSKAAIGSSSGNFSRQGTVDKYQHNQNNARLLQKSNHRTERNSSANNNFSDLITDTTSLAEESVA